MTPLLLLLESYSLLAAIFETAIRVVGRSTNGVRDIANKHIVVIII